MHKHFAALLSIVSCAPALAAAPRPEACVNAVAIQAGAIAPCTGLLVPSSDIRSLMIEIEELTARVAELKGEIEVAQIQKERDAVDLRACEDKNTVIRNTLHACEMTKAPSPVECPKAWGGWPWVALSAGLIVGGTGGWGVGRATCP